MRNLLLTLLATSSVDSLNPIGITQQFILQGMVKKPKHIWYFILTTGVVNMIFGYFVYYGVMSIINNGLEVLILDYGWILYISELILGLIILFFGVRSLIKRIKKYRNNQVCDQNEEEEIKSKIWSVTPIALIGIGVVSTASELTSAFPYFAFLAVLIQYTLPFWLLTIIFVLYNIIYMAPFILLYFVYIISQKTFDKIYDFFRKRFKKVSDFLVPLLLLIVAVIVMFDSVSNMIN